MEFVSRCRSSGHNRPTSPMRDGRSVQKMGLSPLNPPRRYGEVPQRTQQARPLAATRVFQSLRTLRLEDRSIDPQRELIAADRFRDPWRLEVSCLAAVCDPYILCGRVQPHALGGAGNNSSHPRGCARGEILWTSIASASENQPRNTVAARFRTDS